jgi:acylphosphatase
VRNRADGTVEAEIEGEADAVEKMVLWLHRGSPGAAVTAVHLAEKFPVSDSSPFVIRY